LNHSESNKKGSIIFCDIVTDWGCKTFGFITNISWLGFGLAMDYEHILKAIK